MSLKENYENMLTEGKKTAPELERAAGFSANCIASPTTATISPPLLGQQVRQSLQYKPTECRLGLISGHLKH